MTGKPHLARRIVVAKDTVSTRLDPPIIRKLDSIASEIEGYGHAAPKHSETVRVIVGLAMEDNLFVRRVVSQLLQARQA